MGFSAPVTADEDTRAELLLALRAFASLGWIAPFGHVSIRAGKGLLISATSPPLLQRESDMILVGPDGTCEPDRLPDRPLEVGLHLAIYRARSDVGAVVRAHAPATSAWASAANGAPPLAAGLGGFAPRLAQYDDPDLIHDQASGDRVAQRLGDASAILLRGNGAAAVGADIAQASARLWSVEQRCLIGASGLLLRELTEEEIGRRSRWFVREEARTWAWLRTLA